MTKTLLTAVSAVAIMASAPAWAETQTKVEMETEAQSSGSFTKDVENAWEGAKDDAAEAGNIIEDAADDAYDNARAAVNDNDNTARLEKVSVDNRITANGMIGQPVYNVDGDRVAKVRDIIVDQDGDAMMVVLGDGDFTGLGKLVAYDYDIITKRSQDGDVIASLNEEMISNAASFSYERQDRNQNTRVIPSNGYSVSELLDAEVVNPQGESLANVDNIVFRNGRADQLVVSFGTVLGMGGDQAAIAYSDADVEKEGDNVSFKLSANETTQFNRFKQSMKNKS